MYPRSSVNGSKPIASLMPVVGPYHTMAQGKIEGYHCSMKPAYPVDADTHQYWCFFMSRT